MTTRTITLTGRSPVTISEDNWPLIASAKDSDYEGEFEFQANWKSAWWIRVRQHKDGRAIVYAGYTYETNWQNARDYSAKRGVMLKAGSTGQEICDAIRQVCDDIATAEHNGNDAERWDTIAAQCVADMPAEELD